MIAAEQIDTWQTVGQQQLANLATFEREHRTLVRGAVIVAVAATTGAVAGIVIAKGLFVAKGALAVPAAINAATTQSATVVPTTLAHSAAALGHAATMAKEAVATGATTLQNANAMLTNITTNGTAMSSQLTALWHMVSSNALPLTAGAVGGGAVGAGVVQRQVSAVKEQLAEQTSQTTIYQAEAIRLQAALTDIAPPKPVVLVPEPRLSPVREPLEQIRGIGPVFARQLYAAGIFTFADLAVQTPEQLRTIMASVRTNRMFNPQAWIAEAQQRVGMQAPATALPPAADTTLGAEGATTI